MLRGTAANRTKRSLQSPRPPARRGGPAPRWTRRPRHPHCCPPHDVPTVARVTVQKHDKRRPSTRVLLHFDASAGRAARRPHRTRPQHGSFLGGHGALPGWQEAKKLSSGTSAESHSGGANESAVVRLMRRIPDEYADNHRGAYDSLVTATAGQAIRCEGRCLGSTLS
jgi:hypothetical protein